MAKRSKAKPASKPMAKNRAKEDSESNLFKCGKCGQPFSKAHGLAIHIIRTHESTWGKGSKSADEKRTSSVPGRLTLACPKCKRSNFGSGAAYAAHNRHCKGQGSKPQDSRPSVTPFPALRTLGSAPEPVAVAVPQNGNHRIDRLRVLAAQKRREADEIDKLIQSFENCEASAKKYLT